MINLEKNLGLKNFSTFRIGGTVEGFCRIKNEEELQEFFVLAGQEKKPYFILGGGSNILFPDQSWAGWVAKIENDQTLELIGSRVVCGAGVPLSALVNFAKSNGLSGLEWATGIPGTVGGAVRGNAGAFDFEMSDNLESVSVFDLGEKLFKKKTFNKEACQFDYRQSIFKKKKSFLIWEIIFSLLPKEKAEIENKMSEILEKRLSKQPTLGEFPSAGSVFENPQGSLEQIEMFEKESGLVAKKGKIPAGWLIDKCGLRGKAVGGAQISPKQANFIVNLGEASAREVLLLINLAKEEVRNKFGIELKEEIEIFQ